MLVYITSKLILNISKFLLLMFLFVCRFICVSYVFLVVSCLIQLIKYSFILRFPQDCLTFLKMSQLSKYIF